jgi:hypothetical protein
MLARRTYFGTLRGVVGKGRDRVPVLACRFYATDAGREPVQDWLKSLPQEVRKDIGSDIQQVQWRWPVGKPLVDALGGGLFEVRTNVEGTVCCSASMALRWWSYTASRRRAGERPCRMSAWLGSAKRNWRTIHEEARWFDT